MFDKETTRQRDKKEDRIIEKQIRPEIVERLVEFIGIATNEILFREKIYPTEIFSKRLIYGRVLNMSNDDQLSSYVALCLSSIRELVAQQIIDSISINIIGNKATCATLRRYRIEFNLIEDPCLRRIYYGTRQIFNELNDLFVRTLNSIEQVEPLNANRDRSNRTWSFQLRANANCLDKGSRSLQDILRFNSVQRQIPLLNVEQRLLTSGKRRLISTIKSLQSVRLDLQVMVEDDLDEQEIDVRLSNDQRNEEEGKSSTSETLSRQSSINDEKRDEKRDEKVVLSFESRSTDDGSSPESLGDEEDELF